MKVLQRSQNTNVQTTFSSMKPRTGNCWVREKLRMKKEKYTALEQQIRSEVEAISVKTLKDGNVILT